MVLPPDDAPPPADGVIKPIRVRHGKGVFQAGEDALSGADGSFCLNELLGSLMVWFVDGYKFEGDFCDDAMNGSGTFTFASGAFYNGTFKQNKFEGAGVYQWPSGESYDGEFLDNCMHGKGTYKDGSGRQWSGTLGYLHQEIVLEWQSHGACVFSGRIHSPLQGCRPDISNTGA